MTSMADEAVAPGGSGIFAFILILLLQGWLVRAEDSLETETGFKEKRRK